MIKKIKVEQLRLGMVIHALDCDWLSHPFLRSKRKITSKKIIEKIMSSGIREVYIDTSRGLDVAEAPPETAVARDAHAGRPPAEGAEPAHTGRASSYEESLEELTRTDTSHGLDFPEAPSEAGVARDLQTERPPEAGGGLAIAERIFGNEEPFEVKATIEPSRGPDFPEAPLKAEVAREIHTDRPSLEGAERAITKVALLKEEIVQAKEIQKEVRQVTQKLMQDVRLGKQIEEEKVRGAVEKILDSTLRNQDALLTLGTIRKTDEYTYMHSMSVCTMMIIFCSSFYLSRDVVTQVGVGALLHDIGKAKIPPKILNKTSKLSEEETEKLKEHVALGRDVLSQTPGITPISTSVATEHHEHFDGTGYPNGLKGEEISLYGQVAAIVNMYDLLTSDRWYRKGMEPTVALHKLLEWGGSRLNEELVQRFIRRIGIYPVGTLVRMDNGLLGVVVEQGTGSLLHPVVRSVYDVKKGWFVKPHDIDLSNPEGGKGEIKIVCPESPEKWRINPKKYLSQLVETSLLSRRLRAEGSE